MTKFFVIFVVVMMILGALQGGIIAILAKALSKSEKERKQLAENLKKLAEYAKKEQEIDNEVYKKINETKVENINSTLNNFFGGMSKRAENSKSTED